MKHPHITSAKYKKCAHFQNKKKYDSKFMTTVFRKMSHYSIQVICTVPHPKQILPVYSSMDREAKQP